MNFNELASTINENNVQQVVPEMARTPNPAFQSWKATQSPEFLATLKNPYTYWYLKVKGKNPQTAAAPATVANTAPITTSAEETKTKAAVEEFLNAHPEASAEEVAEHLKGLNDQGIDLKTSYITNTAVLDKIISSIKSADTTDAGTPEPEGPAVSDVDAVKRAKFDKLRAFLKMKPEARAKYLQGAEKQKAATGINPDVKDDDEEEEVDIDPDVQKYVSGMKDDDEPDFNDRDES